MLNESHVSVVIPVYQAALTLGRTLASVQQQTHRDLEIIIVDDGSADESAAVARAAASRDARVRVLSQANSGVAAARNLGIAAARGAWVAPIDADDLWHPRKIELQLGAARAAPRPPGFVYCWSRRIDAEDRVLADLGRPIHRGDVFSQLFASNFLRNASSALLRRDAVLAVGGFDPSLRDAGAQGAEDLKLFLMVAEAEPAEVAPYFLTGYRQLPTSMSQAPARMQRSIEMVLGEVEARNPSLPPSLRRLARMNYDLYAATLALGGGDHPGFVRHILAATSKAPVDATALLACHAIWRLSAAARGRRDRPLFLDLAPDHSIDAPLSEWFDRWQQSAADRAARGWIERGTLGAGAFP